MRFYRRVFIMAILALAVLGAPVDAAKYDHLLAVYDALDAMCRGWSGDDPHTSEACEAREKASEALRDVGLCLRGMGAESQWGKCKMNLSPGQSPSPSQTPASPATFSTITERAPFLKVIGQCLSVTVLGVDRGAMCNVSYTKLKNGVEGFFASITPDGVARGPNEPSGPDDVNVTFLGYPTGLIGGIDPARADPKVIYGILKIGAPRTDPKQLANIGEYFFAIQMTTVAQKRASYTTVREQLSPRTPNEGAVVMGWRAPGYCLGFKNQEGNWSLECQVTPNPGNTNRFQFISSGPPPLRAE